jgi:hypothetical protein
MMGLRALRTRVRPVLGCSASAAESPLSLRVQAGQRALATFASEALFHEAADAALNHMDKNLCRLEDEHELEVNMSQGVLKLETPSAGTW